MQDVLVVVAIAVVFVDAVVAKTSSMSVLPSSHVVSVDLHAKRREAPNFNVTCVVFKGSELYS